MIRRLVAAVLAVAALGVVDAAPVAAQQPDIRFQDDNVYVAGDAIYWPGPPTPPGPKPTVALPGDPPLRPGVEYQWLPTQPETWVVRGRARSQAPVLTAHTNYWRRNSDGWRGHATFCWTPIGSHVNCVPGHSLAGFTWTGHSDRNAYLEQDVKVRQHSWQQVCTLPNGCNGTTTTTPTTTSTTCCGPSTTRPRTSTTVPPPTTVPRPTTPPNPRPQPGGVVLYVDFFQAGQSGGSLAPEQIIELERGTYDGDGRPNSFTANIRVTPPPGYIEGTNPGTDEWQTVRAHRPSTNLWARNSEHVLRFFDATRAGETFQIRVTANATADFRKRRWIDGPCTGRGRNIVCQPGYWYWYWDTDPVPVTVIYRPHADGRFGVLSANLQS